MTFYSAALFLHVVGALALFVALGLEWTGLRFLRRAATLQEVRHWLIVLSFPPRMYLGTLAVIVIPGLYMTVAAWGEKGWINVALVTVVFLALIGMTVSRPRMIAIGRGLPAEKETLSVDFRRLLRNPTLWASLHVRAAMALGIVFLMTVRPGAVGSLVTMAVGAGLGLGVALPDWKQTGRQKESATD